MFGRSRSWVGGQGKAKNIHSLDHLKYMYHVLTKNTTVTDNNRNLLVETIRSITEILIWGDQNDSSVFDFFLEKNMFAFFLNILRQKSGRYVCVQLLQTLNILFENISHETSLYYLLSNNHVNSIIVHKFDFSDEEIMAYYISFLKTLSLKLNNHTVHFFYNEHTNDFALYTEAIKFFNHPESMVRIAVRTITLNVYKAAFDVIQFIQVFLIIHYQPLVNALADVILNGDLSVFSSQTDLHSSHKSAGGAAGVLRFIKPPESLERSLELSRSRGRKRTQKRPNYKNLGEEEDDDRAGGGGSGGGGGGGGGGLEESWDDDGCRGEREKGKGTEGIGGGACGSSKGSRASGEMAEEIEMVVMEKCKVSDLAEQNITDEEKTAAATRTQTQRSRPFLDMVYSALECTDDDYQALFVLCLLYAISHSTGINRDLLERLQLPVPDQERSSYSLVLVERLIRIMSQAAQPDGKVRLATLELSCLLLKQSVLSGNHCIIKDVHLACLEGAREESLHLLRSFYRGEEIFLDMFEDEYRSMTSKPLNVEYLMMDASILLPPTGTPLTGIDFVKRLPCGDVEKTRRLHLQEEPETQLPLTRPADLIKTDDVLDLNNSDLIACMVVNKDGSQAQRFLAVDVYQMSLVEPETKRLGWGVVKFAGLLQDMQVSGVEDDSRALNIVIHKPGSNPHAKPLPILQATFIFADHIRCIIAKQRLAKALLDLPVQPSATEVLGFSQTANASPSGLPFRFYEQSRRASNDPTANRSVFASVDKVPGFAVAHCAPQHSPSPLSSPSPPSSGSGSTGRCDSVTASTISAQSPTDDSAFLEHTPPSSSGGEADGGGDGVTGVSSGPCPALAPSLTPASQPTISLLTDSDADALSVESLTLLPPADSPHLHPCAVTHSLHRPGASILEEEEESPQEDGGSPLDETDATVKEETTETVELVTPTDEAADGAERPAGDDDALEFDGDLQQQADLPTQTTAADEAVRTEMPDSPELD
ncbi:Protein CLEC16A [Oryzias melastigma]|uniref:Protein CLEC16A n=1 Tax=Oryzias melastigma TaxID=30732 RepID=A0A834C629_ORYME|nr:Protein CLEC16A [Oryzias melastigma]